MSFQPPKGTDDILPPASRRWRRLFAVWDDLVARYGYELILTPTFEATELFARGVGEGTEVVQKQMYTWRDKAGRSMTLRPEATAGVVRAYLAAGRRGPLKVAYVGPMFRYEQPQAGRRRQFVQVGVEYLGEDAPDADVEVVEVGYRYYEEVGIGDVTVTLNSLGDAESRRAYRETLRAYLEGRRGDLCDDCRRRLDDNPLRVLDCKEDGPTLHDAPATLDSLNEPSREHYRSVKAGLERAGIPYEEDPRLVRGLDYYTRTVFEYLSHGYDAAQDSLGGGGRYDGLSEQLGGPPLPAVGFSLGVDRIVLALGDAEEAAPLDAFVVAVTEERAAAAEALVRRLRAAGVRTDRLLRPASVKAQFKAADRARARYALVVGDEFDDGKATVRDLATGSEELVATTDLAALVLGR